MSNGPILNCASGWCCPPPARVEALATVLRDGAAKAKVLSPETGEVLFHDEYIAMATEVYSKFDTVPKGVGEAIVKGYRPIAEQDFRERRPG